jgi:hypothetical protein
MTDDLATRALAATFMVGLKKRAALANARRKAVVAAGEILDRLQEERKSDWPLVALLVAKELETTASDPKFSTAPAYYDRSSRRV